MPDDLGTREASSDEKAADLKGHSRAERDRQLEELSEAVKLTQPTVGRRTTQRVERSVQMKGRISPLGLRRPDWRGVLTPVTPALAVVRQTKNPIGHESCSRTQEDERRETGARRESG